MLEETVKCIERSGTSVITAQIGALYPRLRLHAISASSLASLPRQEQDRPAKNSQKITSVYGMRTHHGPTTRVASGTIQITDDATSTPIKLVRRR